MEKKSLSQREEAAALKSAAFYRADATEPYPRFPDTGLICGMCWLDWWRHEEEAKDDAPITIKTCLAVAKSQLGYYKEQHRQSEQRNKDLTNEWYGRLKQAEYSGSTREAAALKKGLRGGF